MKKYLSLLLAIAMVLTTMALPVAAADLTSSGTVSLTVAADDEAHPGDEVTVVVSASAENLTYDVASVFVDYNEAAFEYVGTAENVTDTTMKNTSNKVVNWTVELAEAATISEAELVTLTFKVLDNAALADYNFDIIGLDNDTTEFANYTEGTFYDVTATNDTVKVSANTFNVTLDSKPYVKDTTYVNTEGVTLKVTGTNLETVTLAKDSEEAQSILGEDGAVADQVLTAGAYTLTVKVTGLDAVVHTFKVSQTETAVNFAISADGTEYVQGTGTVKVTAAIEGLGEDASADMVSFGLSYDAAKLTPVNKTGLTDNGDGTVSFVYGDNNESVISDGSVAEIEFTVNADAAYGNTSVAVVEDSVKVSLTNDWSGDDASCTVTTSSAAVVIIPADGVDWATVDTTSKTGWSADGEDGAYDITVTPVAGAKVAYVASTETVDTSDLSNLYSEQAVIGEDNKLNINQEADYYLIAKIGDDPASYKLVKKLVNGEDIFYDVTAPSVTNNIDVSKWGSTFENDYTIAVTDENLVVTDTFETTLTYVVGEGESNALGDSIVVPKGTTNGTIVTITVADKAGNQATSNLTLKVDPDAPVITVTQEEQNENNEVVINVSANDTTSNVTLTAKFAKEGAEASDVSITDGKITATESGTYTFTAVDEAGNTATKEEVVTITGAATIPAVTFKTVNSEEAVSGSFKNDTELEAIGVTSNGTFTYVSYTVGAETGENSTTVKLTKDGAEVAAIEGKGKYVLTLTTVNNGIESTATSVSYTFDIVDAQPDMLSPSNDPNYTVRDYAMIRNVIGNATNGLANITAEKGFATYLAGDLNGDLQMTSADYAEIISALKNGEVSGFYDFAIMNVTAAE